MDVEVTWGTGAVDLLFFSFSSSPSPSPSPSPSSSPSSSSSFAASGDRNLALRAAFLAKERPGLAVRVGLITGEAEPHFVGESWGVEDSAGYLATVTALARRLADARYDDNFPGTSRPQCQRLGCGFLADCHGHRAQHERYPGSNGETRYERQGT